MTNFANSIWPSRFDEQSSDGQIFSPSVELHEKQGDFASTSALDHDILEKINEILRKAAVGLQFAYHSETGFMVAVVVDVSNLEVVRLEPEDTAELITSLGKLPALLKNRVILKKWCESRKVLTQCGAA